MYIPLLCLEGVGDTCVSTALVLLLLLLAAISPCDAEDGMCIEESEGDSTTKTMK